MKGEIIEKARQALETEKTQLIVERVRANRKQRKAGRVYGSGYEANLVNLSGKVVKKIAFANREENLMKILEEII